MYIRQQHIQHKQTGGAGLQAVSSRRTVNRVCFAVLPVFFCISLLLYACSRKNDVSRPALSINGCMPSSGMAHTLVTIYGSGFDRDSANDLVTFNGTRASIFQVTDTSLVVLAPEGGSSGSVEVNVAGWKLNAGTYLYQQLSIHSASPLNGPEGTNIRISGVGFSSTHSPAVVMVNNIPAIITNASDTLLVAAVPHNGGTGTIQVQVDGKTATGPVFLYQQIKSIKPASGGGGTVDTLYGKGFGSSNATVAVAFNGIPAAITSINDSMIIASVPPAATTGPVSITMNGQKTVGPVFTVVPPPAVATITPSSGLPGAQVTITGKNFSSISSNNKVDFNGVPAAISTATATKLVVTVPQNAKSGAVNIWVNGQAGQGPAFTVQQLNIASINPDNGLAGTSVTINGNGFGTTSGSTQVYFNGLPAAVTSTSANQLVVTAPANVSTGAISVQVNGAVATGPVFRRAGVSTVYTQTGTVFQSMAIDAAGNFYLTSYNSNNILRVGTDGSSTVFAGSPSNQAGLRDGDAANALFNGVGALTIDQQGNLFVADNGNSLIRKITPDGTVSTYAQGVLTATCLLAIQNTLYIGADNGNMAGSGLFRVTQGTLELLKGGSISSLTADAAGNIYYVNNQNGSTTVSAITATGTNIPVFASGFNRIGSLATDPATGNVLVAEADLHSLTAVSADGIRTTLVSQGNSSVDGTLSQARFTAINGVTVNNQGVLFIIDNNKIRKLVLQ